MSPKPSTANPTRGISPLGRHFTTTGVHPYDTMEWTVRDVYIGPRDAPAFEQASVEFPSSWSETAASIVAAKYFHGHLHSPEREYSLRQLIDRVVSSITSWGMQQGHLRVESEAETFAAELTHLLVHQMVAFNSPVWFNVGVQEQPTTSACFILGVEDTMASVLDWNSIEGRIFGGGSGAGVNLSRVRADGEPISGGGFASGPLSFMRGADTWAGAIKSGGAGRGAKMVVLDDNHPDIGSFITAKAAEEAKAQVLRQAGFDVGPNGEHAFSLHFQNTNHTVRLSDAFMKAVDDDRLWHLTARACGEVVDEVSARHLLSKIATAAWQVGDPGVQFADTVNAWHTTPAAGPIRSSNPCGEFLHVDDSACNLASLNLMAFASRDGIVDIVSLRQAVDVMLTAQDILIDAAAYPTTSIECNSRRLRPLGLGFTNLGALLMSAGVPYDSHESRHIAAGIASLVTARAYRRSSELARILGCYEGFMENRTAHIAVLTAHREASRHLDLSRTFADVALAAFEDWTTVSDEATRTGIRNSQVTALAPAGTISLVMDCDTTGIEPAFSLVTSKALAGGGTVVRANGTVAAGLASLGYEGESVGRWLDHVRLHGSLTDAALPAKHRQVFACAVGRDAISWRGHVEMLAALQPHVSGGISKTVNLPTEATPQDIYDLYVHAWGRGVKSLTVYRDGCRGTQVLHAVATRADGTRQARGSNEETPKEDRRLDSVRGATCSVMHEFCIGGKVGTIVATVDSAGAVRQVSIESFGGDDLRIRGLSTAFACALSSALDGGVPLGEVCRSFVGRRFEPQGATTTPELPETSSLPDYVVRWLALRFGSVELQEELGLATPDVMQVRACRTGGCS